MRSGMPLKTFFPIIGRTITEVPDLVVDIARGIYRKHISSVVDYHLRSSGQSNSLWLVSIRITNLCNHRCAICAQWGRHGYNLDKPNAEITESVPLEVYQKMIDDVAYLKPHIYITGGEPFLYKDILPLINYIKKRRLCIQIVTNGVLLEKYAEEIVESKLDILCVSLDGPRDIHDKCRGVKGAYDTLIKGLGKIQKLKSHSRLMKPYVITLTTISEANANVLVESLNEARQIQPDIMIVYYSWFTTEEIGEKHVAIMQEKLGCSPTAWKGYVINTAGMDLEALVENVKDVKARDFGCPVLFVPNLRMKDLPKYYMEPDNLFGYEKCIAPWFMVDIMPNGDVATCRDHPDYIVGNIQDDSLLNIYNSKRYRTFRQVLKGCEKGLLPICARCCGLMGY